MRQYLSCKALLKEKNAHELTRKGNFQASIKLNEEIRHQTNDATSDK